MPSYVGHTVIPMYEAFYFYKNIFFTKNLADENLVKYLTEIDINDFTSVRSEYIKILNNAKENEIKLNSAKNFFNKALSKKIMAQSFISIFEEYKYIKVKGCLTEQC